MAATSMGQFGSYKIAWSRQRQALAPIMAQAAQGAGDEETVWVTKRYVPTDLRATAPVPRRKLIADSVKNLPPPEPHWIPPAKQTSPYAFNREHEEGGQMYVSSPSTRCEEWSTLRQMLPSRGRPQRVGPPNWGTGYAQPPGSSGHSQKSFPHINSPMTRYVDAMHGTNRLFKLY